AITYQVMCLAAQHKANNMAAISRRLLGRKGGMAVSILYTLLMATTAGAMITGMGELTRLMLPWHGAYGFGIVWAVLLGGWGAFHGMKAMAWGGGWLLPSCLLLNGLLLRCPPPLPVAMGTPAYAGAWALPFACAYAAMNIALGSGVLCEVGPLLGARARRYAAFSFFAILLCLLGSANAVLLLHAKTLRDAVLPMVILSRALGKTGYWLCAACLALAMQTSLVAMLRSLTGMFAERFSFPLAWLCALWTALAMACIGFERIMGIAYPLMGWLSVGALLCLLACYWKERRRA
ncbi:MAG: hypothetical protein RR482_02850, partial [Clostridia bacterium]